MVKDYGRENWRMVERNLPNGMRPNYHGVHPDDAPTIRQRCQYCGKRQYPYRFKNGVLMVRCYGIGCPNNPDEKWKHPINHVTQSRVLRPELHWSPPPPLI